MHATVAYGAIDGPNSSTDIILADIGVLAHPASNATMPMLEIVEESKPTNFEYREPAEEPTKKIGVIIPPLPPKLSVITVNNIFIRKAFQMI